MYMPFVFSVIAIIGCVIGDPAFAAEVPERLAMQTDLDHVWTITAAALVFFMQAGFLLLEAGEVRSKNSVNVAQKNLMDFIVSVTLFGAFGYMLMFGTSHSGWWGWQPDLLFFGSVEDWSVTFFIFQLMFCGTAATIMSGAVAERMAINGYLICTIMISLLIYPVAGHWAWGGLLNGSEEPFLASLGFMDFAGSTVVHSVGAWVGLAAIIILGPRIGKFDDDGKPRQLHGHSPVLSTCGAVILWVGWIGFNGGSVLTGTGVFAHVIANTIIAGAAGGLALMMVGRFCNGVFRPQASINGTLGGLVAITAGADVMTAQSAFFIGLLGGIVVHLATILMENYLKLDDPLGAIAVHGFAGAFGTIAVALFAPEESLLTGSRLTQIWVQFQGVGLVFTWAFGVAFVCLKVVDRVMSLKPGGGGGLRVPSQHELDGLNVSEHDTPMGTGILQTIMAEVARDMNQSKQRLEIDYGDEAYEMSVLFNRIMDNIDSGKSAEQDRYESEKAKRMAVEAEVSEVVLACAKGDYSKRLSIEGKKDFLLELSNGINALCETTETTLGQVSASLRSVSKGDASNRIKGEFDGSLAEIQSAMNATLDTLDHIIGDIQHSVKAAAQGDFTAKVPLDGKDGFFLTITEEINALCEISESGLSELLTTLHAFGNGNLSARMSPNYVGKFADIGKSVETMAVGISQLVSQVSTIAFSVSETGSRISTVNGEILQRSELQVDTLHQSQQLISDLKTATETSVESAGQADKLCKEAAESALRGRELTTQTRNKMAQIKSASAAIAETIKTIEGIATQTTMLSLNASVEAVRGGHDGNSSKGFQVVAQEVRNLATRTAEAAREIRSRVAAVEHAVDQGASLVSDVDQSLDEITASMQHSAGRVAQLFEVGKQQKQQAADMEVRAVKAYDSAQKNFLIATETAGLSKVLDEEAARTIEYLQVFQSKETSRSKAA